MRKKKALITDITGQDDIYLTEYLLDKILNTKDQVKFFEENKHEYVNLLKNICIILPMNKKNQILSSFQNRLFKISEENSSSLIRSGMLIIQKIQFYKNLVRKNNTEKEKSILGY
jgi:hypothetical protein